MLKINKSLLRNCVNRFCLSINIAGSDFRVNEAEAEWMMGLEVVNKSAPTLHSNQKAHSKAELHFDSNFIVPVDWQQPARTNWN